MVRGLYHTGFLPSKHHVMPMPHILSIRVGLPVVVQPVVGLFSHEDVVRRLCPISHLRGEIRCIAQSNKIVVVSPGNPNLDYQDHHEQHQSRNPYRAIST